MVNLAEEVVCTFETFGEPNNIYNSLKYTSNSIIMISTIRNNYKTKDVKCLVGIEIQWERRACAKVCSCPSDPSDFSQLIYLVISCNNITQDSFAPN